MCFKSRWKTIEISTLGNPKTFFGAVLLAIQESQSIEACAAQNVLGVYPTLTLSLITLATPPKPTLVTSRKKILCSQLCP